MKQIYNSETKIQLRADGQPMQIIQITPVWPEMPKEDNAPPRFTGNTMLAKKDPNGKVIGQMPFSFPIQAPNLQEAFAKFEEAGQKALEKLEKEMRDQKPSIITPGPQGMPQ